MHCHQLPPSKNSSFFWLSFLMDFGWIFDHFFDVFSYFLHPFFETYFWMFVCLVFSHCSAFLFLGEPSATRLLLGKTYGFSTFTFFGKIVFSRKQISKSIKIAHYLCIDFSSKLTLFRHQIPQRFWGRLFDGKCSQNDPRKLHMRPLIFDHEADLFRRSFF